jgi:hypothetical protein
VTCDRASLRDTAADVVDDLASDADDVEASSTGASVSPSRIAFDQRSRSVRGSGSSSSNSCRIGIESRPNWGIDGLSARDRAKAVRWNATRSQPGPLVEPQRGGVVIGGDEPEPPPTGAPRQRSGGIQQQGPDSGDVFRRLAPRRSARQPRTRGHAADDAGEPLELAERPTADEPRRYDSFCNVAATATGLVTVSKTGDSDRAASRISCRVSSSASEATR